VTRATGLQVESRADIAKKQCSFCLSQGYDTVARGPKGPEASPYSDAKALHEEHVGRKMRIAASKQNLLTNRIF